MRDIRHYAHHLEKDLSELQDYAKHMEKDVTELKSALGEREKEVERQQRMIEKMQSASLIARCIKKWDVE